MPAGTQEKHRVAKVVLELRGKFRHERMPRYSTILCRTKAPDILHALPISTPSRCLPLMHTNTPTPIPSSTHNTYRRVSSTVRSRRSPHFHADSLEARFVHVWIQASWSRNDVERVEEDGAETTSR